jgi:transcriptional regulator with XRE-family HTH domain
MQTYDFTFIVGSDPHEEDFEDVFIAAGCDDATFVLRRGALAVSFDREGKTYKDAVLSAYRDIRSTGSEIIRFEPDFLVSAPEIAERANLSRAAIDNYARGQRRDGFPLPEARISAKSPLWDWVDVSRWLCEREMLDEREYRYALVSRVINLGVQIHQVDPTIEFDIEEKLMLV